MKTGNAFNRRASVRNPGYSGHLRVGSPSVHFPFIFRSPSGVTPWVVMLNSGPGPCWAPGPSRCGEMADAGDLKSPDLTIVRVQVPPAAPRPEWGARAENPPFHASLLSSGSPSSARIHFLLRIPSSATKRPSHPPIRTDSADGEKTGERDTQIPGFSSAAVSATTLVPPSAEFRKRGNPAVHERVLKPFLQVGGNGVHWVGSRK